MNMKIIFICFITIYLHDLNFPSLNAAISFFQYLLPICQVPVLFYSMLFEMIPSKQFRWAGLELHL